MRRITMALMATTAGLAVVIGAKAESAGSAKPALAAGSHTTDRPTTTGPASTGGGQANSPTTSSPGAGSGRFTGSVVDTPYGPVQVQAVMTGDRLTDVTVLQQTRGGRSTQIDSYALPQLKAEALKAQGATIDVVSGATYTSDGYAESLQAALDAAHR